MYKERLKEITKKIGGNSVEFFILTKRKTKREIYFRNKKEAIQFIEKKMGSNLFKKIVYFFIKKRLLQPFLEKTSLSSKLGEVILVANRIKGFDLDKKIVTSFPLKEENKEGFLKFLKIRKTLGNIAPRIISLDEKIPYYQEELLEQYEGAYSIPLKKLKELNKKTGLIHGDLVKEHILKKGDSCVFTDWEDIRKGSFEEDLKIFKMNEINKLK